MILVSKNSSLRALRGDSAPVVIRQQGTPGGYGFKPVPDSSRAPADSEMANPINWVLAVFLVVALVVVLARVLAVALAVALARVPLAMVLAVLSFLSYTRCDLLLYVNVKPSFRFDWDDGGGVTRKRCKPFHYSARTVARCRTGNRRRRTVPATEPNRAAIEIALPCTCSKAVLQAQFFWLIEAACQKYCPFEHRNCEDVCLCRSKNRTSCLQNHHHCLPCVFA